MTAARPSPVSLRSPPSPAMRERGYDAGAEAETPSPSPPLGAERDLLPARRGVRIPTRAAEKEVQVKTDDRGRSVRRVEDFRFLTGGGRYVDDFSGPGQVYAHVLRSPHAHAAIERIDTGAARGGSGVLGVFTEGDLRADGIGPLPCIAQVSTVDPMIVPPRYALARGRVRHVGDPVALVVAETRDLARDAAERIAVEYRPLDAVADGAAALLPGGAGVWGGAPGNSP